MKRTPVDSSALNRVGYDPTREILEIEFKSGNVYQYFHVPPSVYEALLKADSLGAFVNEQIKGSYQFVQL